MAQEQPLWRQAFDTVERAVGAPLEAGVRTDTIADAVALAVRARSRVGREIERQSRRALHLVNLPAASDMRRLSEQVSAPQRQVRTLSKELEKERRR